MRATYITLITFLTLIGITFHSRDKDSLKQVATSVNQSPTETQELPTIKQPDIINQKNDISNNEQKTQPHHRLNNQTINQQAEQTRTYQPPEQKKKPPTKSPKGKERKQAPLNDRLPIIPDDSTDQSTNTHVSNFQNLSSSSTGSEMIIFEESDTDTETIMLIEEDLEEDNHSMQVIEEPIPDPQSQNFIIEVPE